MNEAYTIDREFLFKTSIYEITSISIEHQYDINDSNIDGEFTISGDYRLHEISINKEDFCFKVPFTHTIKNNIDKGTIDIEITDFSYSFKNGDELSVHIEYVITAKENITLLEDQKELEEYLAKEDIEVVDLKDEEETSRADELLDEFKIEEEKESQAINKNMIINNTSPENTYVKYHVHTVTMEDTIENICSKYGVNINTLKKYNTFDNLELNMKLLIPENEES